MRSIRNDLMEDIIMLGIIFTINCYVILIMNNMINGIDIYLKSLSKIQTIGLLISIFISQVVIELFVRFLQKESAYKLSRFIMGGFVIFVSYTICITTGGTDGYDDKISSMTPWDFQNLLSIEFMYFCFILAYLKVKDKNISH